MILKNTEGDVFNYINNSTCSKKCFNIPAGHKSLKCRSYLTSCTSTRTISQVSINYFLLKKKNH